MRRHLFFSIILILFAATADRAVALKYSEVEKICPLDGTKFKAKVVTSFTRLGTRLDFKPLGHIAAPRPVAVCPTDHFVLYKSKFDQSEVSKLRKFINSSAYQDQVPGNSSYYLMAKIFEFLGKSSETIAETYLKASWQVEYKDPKKYTRYVYKSLEYYERFLAQHKQRDKKTLSTEVLCAELERRLALFDNAEKRLTRVKEQFKVDMRSALGRIILYEMRLIEAKDSDPHEIPDSPFEGADFHYNRGKTYIGTSQYDKAIADFSKAIEIDPNFSQSYMERAWAYKKKDRYDKAIADFSKAIEITPDSVYAFMGRGETYISMNQYDKAIADFSKAIEIEPRSLLSPSLYLDRGETYILKGQYDKAIADFSKAIEIEGRSFLGCTLYVVRGSAYRDNLQYDKAIADFSKAIEIDQEYFGASKGDSRTYTDRGETYRLKGQYDKAIADFSKAIEIKPDNMEAHNNLAWLFATCPESKYRNGSKAVLLAQKAVELNPSPGSLDTLAAAYAEAGNFEMAVKTEQKAFSMKNIPEFKKLIEVYKKGKTYSDYKYKK